MIPGYMLHFTVRPYREQITAAFPHGLPARLSGRHAAASLDAWVGQLLSAYPEVAGYSVKKGSGQLAIHYIRIAAALNREYEHRLATGKSLRLEQLLKDQIVASRLAEWERFTARYTRDRAVVRFMSGDDVIADYDNYVSVTTRTDFSINPALQIESIKLDSGGYLTRLARLIDRFNQRHANPGAPAEFFQLGMAAKFADELADLATDQAEGRYNLLLALLSQHPDESADVMVRLVNGLPIPISWWLEFAPQTFAEFSSLFDGYYSSLRSQQLRRICDVSMLRALGGPKKRQSARARQHVSERPSPSWR
jgi:hypothetical protein